MAPLPDCLSGIVSLKMITKETSLIVLLLTCLIRDI